MARAPSVTSVNVSAIAPQCAAFRALALSADESTMFMHIEDGPLGKHWYWWKRGTPGTMRKEFELKTGKYPKVITGKFTIKSDE